MMIKGLLNLFETLKKMLDLLDHKPDVFIEPDKKKRFG